MSTTSLTDRYVDAAMRTVPENQRDDLAAELRASIDDQVEARVEQGDARDAAERAVLTDLGDPEKLAAQYTDRPLWLVGPRYYLTWWRLTKLLWAIVPACAAPPPELAPPRPLLPALAAAAPARAPTAASSSAPAFDPREQQSASAETDSPENSKARGSTS